MSVQVPLSDTATQLAMACRCGNGKILALGLCATCYTLKRHDEEYFGGLRNAVLERDGYACRVCGASGRDKRSIIVHHRVPGKSRLHLMISLCPACHARVHRTKAVVTEMSPLLLELWREQHPNGQEQFNLNFNTQTASPGGRVSAGEGTTTEYFPLADEQTSAF